MNNNFSFTYSGDTSNTTFGIIINDLPSGIFINKNEIKKQFNRCFENKYDNYTFTICSGITSGMTNGLPINIMVEEQHNSNYYFSSIYNKDLYLNSKIKSYLIAGSIADKIIKQLYGIDITAWVYQIGYLKYNIKDDLINSAHTITRNIVDNYITRCPNNDISSHMEQIIKEHSKENDSLGGVVTCVCRMIPKDLEEQLFKRFKSIVSYYLMSIPGVTGIEFDEGFSSADCSLTQFRSTGLYMDELSLYHNCLSINVSFKPPYIKRGIISNDLSHYYNLYCLPITAVPIIESVVAISIYDSLIIKKNII